jgi:hypothetical protein
MNADLDLLLIAVRGRATSTCEQTLGTSSRSDSSSGLAGGGGLCLRPCCDLDGAAKTYRPLAQSLANSLDEFAPLARRSQHLVFTLHYKFP